VPVSVQPDEDEFDRRLRLGQHRELVPDLLDAVETDPLQGRRWSQLMLAQYRCGRQLEALRTAERLRAIFHGAGLELPAPCLYMEHAIMLEKPELDWTAPSP
jgi:hypothetical protein